MTAYKYVERKVEDQINWAEVGRNFSNVLQEEVRVRGEKKKAIDDASRAYQEVLNNTPQGDYGLANTFALDGADKLQKQALMQLTLLKSGQLDPKRYTIMQQNLVDGTDQLYGLAQGYQDEWKRKMELMADGTPPGERLSGLEAELMASIEGLGNLANHEVTINPDTGMMGIGVMDADGNLKSSTTAFALQKRLKSDTREFDMMGASDKWLKSLGKDERAAFENVGNKLTADVLITISDVTQKLRPGGSMSELTDDQLAQMSTLPGVEVDDLKTLSLYREAQMNYVKSQLSPEASGTNAASMLFDHVGGYNTYILGVAEGKTQADYDALSEEEKAKVILVTTENGNPKFQLTDDQLAIAERAFESQIDIGLNYTEKQEAAFREKESRAVAPPNAAQINNKLEEESKASRMSQWMNVRNTNDPIQRKNLMDAILMDPKSIEKGIVDVKFKAVNGNDVMELIYSDPALNKTGDNAIVINQTGKPPTQEQWALAGVAIHDVSDPQGMEKAAGGYRKDPDDFVTTYKPATGVGVKRDEQDMSPSQATDAAYKQMEQQMRAANVASLKDDDKSAPALAKIGKPFGIVVTHGINNVTITRPGEDGKTFSQGDVEAMMSYMLTDINPTNAQRHFKAQKKTSSKRTITQIMKEDGVSRAEAVKIFNNQ